MTIDAALFQRLLGEFKLEQLFNELGWDRAGIHTQEIKIAGETFTLNQLAQKRGVVVFLCSPDTNGNIPPRPTLLKIEKEAIKLAHEHLLIFTDAAQSMLTWLWVSRAPGQPIATRAHTWHKGTSGESLRQKLNQIVWGLEEEEAITLTDVITGLRRAFDRDRVTKKFYDLFKAEHQAFTDFINGIATLTDQAWYASLMLNRLMFVYFIQQKGFLDSNQNYLADRMQRVREQSGKGHFHSFYRLFLRRLFHEGLGQHKSTRGADLSTLIGDVPYLNGGLFAVHELEEAHPDIDIPDEAFERLFKFFDAYDWHLDERPLAKGNEINPDVLGYIFEKYINQKQMGAYYTKEDITEYISKNTVIPHLLEQARDHCKAAFEGDTSVWSLLKNDPGRCIYPAMKTGVVDASGNLVLESALPDFVQNGMYDPKARMFERRFNLGEALFHTATGERGTLPTETWREYVERRTRCLTLSEKLANGEVCSIDELVTLNLDIRQFMQDVIDTCSGPELLRAIWHAIVGRMQERPNEKFCNGITILDPTCGSGAFLFAALNVLEPLYEACLDRMEGFVEDARKLGKPIEEDFSKVLNEVGRHPSRRYFIYKSIILHNLFGVDIMAEAVEICKLRLFLKLVSQVDGGRDLEPLPDIDFNIRCGNTLIGYATYDAVKLAVTSSLDFDKAMEKIAVKAVDLQQTFDKFRQLQTEGDGSVHADDKVRLQNRLQALEDELNRHLASEYGVKMTDKDAYVRWVKSHQPFHWFIQFYSIITSGGFDAIIGNPPYVEYREIKNVYQLRGYKTEDCSNLFAYVLERCTQLSHSGSQVGMIIPLSAFSTDRMTPLINHLKITSNKLRVANFSWRPGKLFDGVNLQLSIVLQKVGYQCEEVDSTRYLMWSSEARPELFFKIEYVRTHDSRLTGSIPKLGASEAASILKKLRSHKKEIGGCFTQKSNNKVYYRRGGLYWKVFVDFVTGSSEEKIIFLLPEIDKYTIIAALSSDLWWWYFTITSDCRHLGNRDIQTFPFDPRDMSSPQQQALSNLGKKYVKDLKRNAVNAIRVYKGKKSVDCLSFRVNQSKPILDEIDTMLAGHFNLTEKELDFILNYDIKYRMSSDESVAQDD